MNDPSAYTNKRTFSGNKVKSLLDTNFSQGNNRCEYVCIFVFFCMQNWDESLASHAEDWASFITLAVIVCQEEMMVVISAIP